MVPQIRPLKTYAGEVDKRISLSVGLVPRRLVNMPFEAGGNATNYTPATSSSDEGLLGPPDLPTIHMATRFVTVAMVALIFIVGGYGNVQSLASVIKSKKTRSGIGSLLILLALTDLLICIVLAPVQIYLLFGQVPYKLQVCTATAFLGTTLTSLSLCTVGVIAIQRQSKVASRYERSSTSCRSLLFLISLPAFSLFLATSATLLRLFRSRKQLWCIESSCYTLLYQPYHHMFYALLLGPIAFITILTVSVSYCVISRAILQQWKLKELSMNERSAGLLSVIVTNKETEFEKGGSKSNEYVNFPYASPDKHTKVIIMCIFAILVVLLCWGPFIVCHVFEIWLQDRIFLLNQLKLISSVLVIVNSAINPFVYVSHSSKWNQVPVLLEKKAERYQGCTAQGNKAVPGHKSLGMVSPHVRSVPHGAEQPHTATGSFSIMRRLGRHYSRTTEAAGSKVSSDIPSVPTGVRYPRVAPLGHSSHTNESNGSNLFHTRGAHSCLVSWAANAFHNNSLCEVGIAESDFSQNSAWTIDAYSSASKPEQQQFYYSRTMSEKIQGLEQ